MSRLDETQLAHVKNDEGILCDMSSQNEAESADFMRSTIMTLASSLESAEAQCAEALDRVSREKNQC